MDVIVERTDIDASVSGKTVCTIFADAEKRWGDLPALRWKRNGDWHALSWHGYREQVAWVTLGLRELGFGAGQFGLIMARNVPGHVIADLGIVHAGGAAISVYNTLPPEQIEYVANHSQATVAFVEDEGFLAKFLSIRSSTPSLRHIVLIHGDAPDGVMSWDSLIASGRAAYERDPSAFETSARAVGPEDTVSLIYTSGTTGPPKGVMYSHNNIVWTLESARRVLELHNETLLSYLPLAHVSERFTSQWGSIYNGHETYLCPDPAELLPYLLEARPTAFVGVPRVWEKLMAGINAGLGAEPDEAKRNMAQGALAASMQAYRLRRDGQPVPPELAAVVERAQPLFTLLRSKIGLERCHLAITSTAPCRPEVHEFWAALGMPLYEVWGMSELTGPATAVPPNDHKAPSIGIALPGVEVRLGDDGELLVRGGNVMVGYYRDPEKTADTVDKDGWVHSGDIAVQDADGHFRIVDRKKELIITSAGKNISPANLEALAKSSPIIGQAVAIGDGRRFISVLVVLDPQVAPMWAKAQGIEAPTMAELADHPVTVGEVRRALTMANTHLARVEQFKRFTILPSEWSPESEELTPTMKLKRRVIESKYRSQIEAMYGEAAGGHPVDADYAAHGKTDD
ncbi:MAG TPA: long-chain fatty acid--CoA ligase [Candidatus Dormibacteraeota bacterium]|nr:long-chain fatty acid--CoA ligase [Candidatus Dormibacteraeota bacterium]